ncbi:CPXCG motif-containing cysteine-rich protein [Marinospirillum sp.]|uniref:CPXCG motif-containing cysteine-rich protein n=1 Tax=Marinospirillum sp. TaxID=2183934 RepID=UPI0028700191|nr:CPXCG motif-containing cysteine-rich protein [Marinospirillum sp.]MDR9466844.1 CPXCG motif-containing cysteine-rich protein [Marinospirillum sp.]
MNEAMLITIQDNCPYCGSDLELAVDTSAGSQEYIEDCEVCCAPISVAIQVGMNGELVAAEMKRDSD